MPHEDEEPFQDRVKATLIDWFGEDNVVEEFSFPDTGREADLIAEVPMGENDLVIEIEDDFEGAIASIGQTEMYAAQAGARPVIIVPEGHVDVPELFYLLDSDVAIVQWPEDV